MQAGRKRRYFASMTRSETERPHSSQRVHEPGFDAEIAGRAAGHAGEQILPLVGSEDVLPHLVAVGAVVEADDPGDVGVSERVGHLPDHHRGFVREIHPESDNVHLVGDEWDRLIASPIFVSFKQLWFEMITPNFKKGHFPRQRKKKKERKKEREIKRYSFF